MSVISVLIIYSVIFQFNWPLYFDRNRLASYEATSPEEIVFLRWWWQFDGDGRVGSSARRGVWLLFDILANVKWLNGGLLGWWWPYNTPPLRSVSYWLRTRLSWLRPLPKVPTQCPYDWCR